MSDFCHVCMDVLLLLSVCRVKWCNMFDLLIMGIKNVGWMLFCLFFSPHLTLECIFSFSLQVNRVNNLRTTPKPGRSITRNKVGAWLMLNWLNILLCAQADITVVSVVRRDISDHPWEGSSGKFINRQAYVNSWTLSVSDEGGCISPAVLCGRVTALPAARQKDKRFLTGHPEMWVVGSFPFLQMLH